jgi:hypothetical protein
LAGTAISAFEIAPIANHGARPERSDDPPQIDHPRGDAGPGIASDRFVVVYE